MSHECPDCGEICYCNGDIDDCCNNFYDDVLECDHWKQCEKELDEEVTNER